MRADRLLRMALLLQARGRTTAAGLAAELEVSVRTIYRDLEALSSAGIPVYAESGPGGGCQLLDGYRNPLAGLTRHEATALLTLGVPPVLSDLGAAAAMTTAHNRVRAAAGIPNTGPRVHLDMPRWFHQREETPHLATLASAIDEQRVVDISYRITDSAGGKSRRVRPLGLVNKAGVWYLVSNRASGPTIVYRVSRVRSVRRLQQTFPRPEDFDLVDFWDRWSVEFEASRPRLGVTVRASPHALAIMPEILGGAVLPALEAAGSEDGDGWREIVLTFEHEEAAAHRLAGFGGHIDILSPAAVRARLVETAEETLARYLKH